MLCYVQFVLVQSVTVIRQCCSMYRLSLCNLSLSLDNAVCYVQVVLAQFVCSRNAVLCEHCSQVIFLHQQGMLYSISIFLACTQSKSGLHGRSLCVTVSGFKRKTI